MPRLGMDGDAGGGVQPGADALMQLYDPQRVQRRNLMDFVRPMDSSAIAQVQAALGAGLDPSTAASLLGNLASGVTGRFDQYQTNRQDARSTATDALMRLAQTNPDPAAAQTYIDSYSQIHPGMGQQLSPTLEGLVGQLYPGGDSSPLYQDPNAQPATAQGLTSDDIAGVYQDAMVFAQGDQANGIPPLPLHDARMRIMGQLRAQGYPEGDLQAAYDAIGSAYGAVGGPINAPLTSADRLAAMAPQASPAPAAVASPPPTSSPFGGFQSQFPARPYG